MRAFPRTPHRTLLRSLAASVLLLLAALPLHARNPLGKLAGNYRGETRAEDETRAQSRDGQFAIRHHTIALSLGPDGTATLTQSPDAVSETTSFAHWTYAAGRITLTFQPAADGKQAAPMIFTVKSSELTPVTWDHALWKQMGPPKLHRE